MKLQDPFEYVKSRVIEKYPIDKKIITNNFLKSAIVHSFIETRQYLKNIGQVILPQQLFHKYKNIVNLYVIPGELVTDEVYETFRNIIRYANQIIVIELLDKNFSQYRKSVFTEKFKLSIEKMSRKKTTIYGMDGHLIDITFNKKEFNKLLSNNKVKYNNRMGEVDDCMPKAHNINKSYSEVIADIWQAWHFDMIVDRILLQRENQGKDLAIRNFILFALPWLRVRKYYHDIFPILHGGPYKEFKVDNDMALLDRLLEDFSCVKDNNGNMISFPKFNRRKLQKIFEGVKLFKYKQYMSDDDYHTLIYILLDYRYFDYKYAPQLENFSLIPGKEMCCNVKVLHYFTNNKKIINDIIKDPHKTVKIYHEISTKEVSNENHISPAPEILKMIKECAYSHQWEKCRRKYGSSTQFTTSAEKTTENSLEEIISNITKHNISHSLNHHTSSTDFSTPYNEINVNQHNVTSNNSIQSQNDSNNFQLTLNFSIGGTLLFSALLFLSFFYCKDKFCKKNSIANNEEEYPMSDVKSVEPLIVQNNPLKAFNNASVFG